jgi:hypothetical protein
MLCNTYLTEDIHIKWMINLQLSRQFQLDSISQLYWQRKREHMEKPLTFYKVTDNLYR